MLKAKNPKPRLAKTQPTKHTRARLHTSKKPRKNLKTTRLLAPTSTSTSPFSIKVSHSDPQAAGATTISIPDAHMAFGPTSPNTQLFYPPSFSLPDIHLVEKYSKQTITTFSLKGLMKYGHPHISNALISANFLYSELPARYAQRIELLRDAPFDLNRHPLLQQIQFHYLQSLKLITTPKAAPTNIEELHHFNSNILLPLIYQSSLLPSSVLSHAICTAFSDILLQQLILLQHILPSPPLELAAPTTTTPTTATPSTAADLAHIPSHSPTQQSQKYLGAEAENRRRSVYGLLDDSSSSLQLFNSLLQEILDSFNVSRLDTRLLMIQHITFCSQLFKQLDVDADYIENVDFFSSLAHDAQFASPHLLEFFSKHPNWIEDYQAESNGVLESTPSSHNLANFLKQKKQERLLLDDASAASAAAGGKPQPFQHYVMPHAPWKTQDGYGGYIGICQLHLKFAEVIASSLPFAAFQSAARCVEYFLFQEYHNFYQTGVVGEKTELMAKKPQDGHVPLPDSIASLVHPKVSNTTIQAVIKYLHSTGATTMSEEWVHEVETSLQAQLAEQLEQKQKHHLINHLDSVVLEVPPIKLTIPSLEVLHEHFDAHFGEKNKATDKSDANADTNKTPTSTKKTMDVVIPIPKIRINGDLSHSILYSRPHANLIMRELLSNSIEQTIMTSFQLTSTTLLEHLSHPPNDDQNGAETKNGKNVTLGADADKSAQEVTLDTMGSLASDYKHIHNTYLPPIETWLVKASSQPAPAGPGSEEYDIFSIKVSDRANGVTRTRSKAILTYGNKLIDTTLRTIRTYKLQQQQLHQHHLHVEQLRLLHNSSLNPERSSPFIPPPLPPHLLPENISTVRIPTNESYSPTALFDMGMGGVDDDCETLGIAINSLHFVSDTQVQKFPRGFGLPLAKAMVNYLNGDFHLNSVDGFGTDVYIKLKV